VPDLDDDRMTSVRHIWKARQRQARREARVKLS